MIRPLAEAPEVVPALAELMQAVWPGWYGPEGQGNALADLRARTRPAGLPWGVVALSDAGVLGGAALVATSHGAEEDEGPWIGGLLVATGARGRGIGSSLLAACEDQARHEGFLWVFATTVTARGMVLKRGWQVMRGLTDGHEVFRKALD